MQEQPDLDRQKPLAPAGQAVALRAYRYARRLVVAIVGGTTVVVGVVMLFTPGPAMVLIPAGLAILAVEFAWARRLLKRSRNAVAELGVLGVRRGQASVAADQTRIEEKEGARENHAESAE